MYPSRYNIMLPNEPVSGHMLIFNTLSGSLFELEPAYCQSLRLLRKNGALDSEDIKRLTKMAKEGYVVQDKEAETNRVIHMLRSLTYRHVSIFKAIVVITMTCNLACKYCFESSMKKQSHMSLEMAKILLEEITYKANKSLVQTIELDYYGGEPLLNIEVIEFLSNKLNTWCDEKKKSYSFTLTSNGTLLNRELVKKILKWGLVGTRITIDGLKETHDKRRPFRSGKGSSFETIMKNVRSIVDILPVTLVYIYAEDTAKHLPIFLNKLEQEGLLNKLAFIQVGPELPYFDKKGMICGNSQCTLSKGSAENFVWSLNQLKDRGAPLPDEPLQGTNCPVVTANGPWVFCVNGSIHKCPLIMGKEEFAIGHVGQQNRKDFYYHSVTKEIWQNCLQKTDCPYVPICGVGAGCRYIALVKTGDLWGDGCGREFLDHFIPEMMRLEYSRTCMVQ